jgi:hypothetical protein
MHTNIYITTFSLMRIYKIFMTIEEMSILKRWLQRDSYLNCQVKQISNQEGRTSTVRLHCIRCSKPNRFKFYSRFIQATQTYNYGSQVTIGAWNFMEHFRTELYAVFAQTGSRVWDVCLSVGICSYLRVHKKPNFAQQTQLPVLNLPVGTTYINALHASFIPLNISNFPTPYKKQRLPHIWYEKILGFYPPT